MVIEDDVVVKEESEKLLKEVDENLGDLREYVQPIVESILGRYGTNNYYRLVINDVTHQYFYILKYSINNNLPSKKK